MKQQPQGPRPAAPTQTQEDADVADVDRRVGWLERKVAGAYVQFVTKGNGVGQVDVVHHSLGRIPTNFEIVSQDKACVLTPQGTAWTSTDAYLTSTVARVVITVRLF